MARGTLDFTSKLRVFMASTPLRIMLWTVLVSGTAAACVGGDDVFPADEVSTGADVPTGTPTDATTGRPTVAAPWVADPDGPTLFQYVTERARDLAGRDHLPPSPVASRSLSDLTYGQYRDIRFRSDRSIWRGRGPFEVQLFHPGGGNDTPVRIHLVDDGESRTLPFDASFFEYGEPLEGVDLTLPPEAGYAGLRVLYPLNDPARMDEVAVFLGATYFRLLGPGHVHGLSGRGLAVDIAEPTGEEFPEFVEYWLARPEAEADRLTFYALLDGPSITGAYRFELVPGEMGDAGGDEDGGGGDGEAGIGDWRADEDHDGAFSRGTVLGVEARLFVRRDIRKLGVAPITSMYLHGTLGPGGDDDFRPRVHDSEGLLMHTSRGEWIWRPLTNRADVRVTSLRDVDPAGFGLVQRTRDFGGYMDLEALYHRRPSHWVAIDGDWGPGGVELLEFPTVSEFNDNVVAYWSPDDVPAAGEERRFRYRLITFDDLLHGGDLDGGPVDGQTVAHVVRTRIGRDALPGETDPPPRSRRRVVVDFEGGGLGTLPPDAEVVARVETSAGTISDVQVQMIPGGGRRATFALVPDGDRGADMRLFLQSGDAAVTETWSYLWEPDPVR